MVIRRAKLIFAVLVTHYFECTVCYYLVSIHVHSSTCTSLYHVTQYILVLFSGYELFARLAVSLILFVREFALLVVCYCRTFLGNSHADNESRIVVHQAARNFEVFEAAHGLYTVESLDRYLFCADEIALGTGLS